MLIAGILAIIIAAYLRPLYKFFLKRLNRRMASAVLTLLVVIVPVLGALAYSYLELVDVLGYISAHQIGGRDADRRIDPASARSSRTSTRPRRYARYVLLVSDYGTKIPARHREAVVELSVAGNDLPADGCVCVYGCRLDRQLCEEQGSAAL